MDHPTGHTQGALDDLIDLPPDIYLVDTEDPNRHGYGLCVAGTYRERSESVKEFWPKDHATNNRYCKVEKRKMKGRKIPDGWNYYGGFLYHIVEN